MSKINFFRLGNFYYRNNPDSFLNSYLLNYLLQDKAKAVVNIQSVKKI